MEWEKQGEGGVEGEGGVKRGRGEERGRDSTHKGVLCCSWMDGGTWCSLIWSFRDAATP